MKCTQDTKQKYKVALGFCLEFYRVCMGSFLLLFTPQECEDRLCTLDENKTKSDVLSTIGTIINSFTMFSFLLLYGVEIIRENKCIDYLEVNKRKPFDNESVGKELSVLPHDKLKTLHTYDENYKYMGYGTTITFILNTTYSGILIYKRYLNLSTLTVFITNVLFMGLKVTDVYTTVYTKKNIFYSAYMKKKVQFNDVDPDVVPSFVSV